MAEEQNTARMISRLKAKVLRDAMTQIPLAGFFDSRLRTTFASHVSMLYPFGIPIEESVVGEILLAWIDADVPDDLSGSP